MNQGIPSLTIPLAGYTVTSYAYTSLGAGIGWGNVSFNVQLSSAATSNLLSTYLSGSSTVAAHILSGTMGPIYSTALTAWLSALSAAPAAILFRWPSIDGNQDIYGYIASSTIVPSASTWTAKIQFANQEFNNTVYTLSGSNSSMIVLDTSDNPYYDTGIAINTVNSGLSSVNENFRTVAEHCRLWNLNG